MATNPYIKAIRYYLPPRKVPNDDLVIDTGWSAEKIYRKTGILERRCVDEELASDLAVRAAEMLFDEEVIRRQEIDFLLLCIDSPDYLLPSTACILQDRLHLPTSCGALAYDLACSGFVYGLALAKGLISSGEADSVLLLTTGSYTKYIHPRDRSIRTLVGDAAAVTLIQGEGDGGRLGKFVFGTDGRGAGNLIIPAGGAVLPRSSETAIERMDESGNVRSQDNLYMNGPEVLNFSLRAVPASVKGILDKYGMTKGDIDLFVLHQANRFMLDNLRKTMGIPEEKFYVNLEKVGNTVSSSIPIALRDAEVQGRLGSGDRVVLVGFGTGYSWGATLLEY